MFSHLCDFLKLHKEYLSNTNILYPSCLCESSKNGCLLVTGVKPRRKKRLSESFPSNLHNTVKKSSSISNQRTCIWNKRSTSKSSVIVETLTSNEESESKISIATTDESSDDSSDKCDVTFYRWKAVEKKELLNQKFIYHLTMQYLRSKKI